MSFIAADWTIDRQTGNIRYVGDDHNGTSPSYATVIEFHRWLMDLADDDQPADVSDEIDITNTLPSTRSTDNIITLINGYNIDDGASEHLYDGSIIQDGGDTIYDGIVNFGNADVQIQILQDGAILSDDWWNYGKGGTATGGSGTTLVDSGQSWTTDQWEDYTIVNTTEGCKGIATSNTGTTITFSAGELFGGTNNDFSASDGYLIGEPLNGDANAGISHRFMLKTRADGVDIDGRRLIGVARRLGKTFAEFKINGTSRGNNVLALSDSNDLNNTTANATVVGSTWDTDFSGETLGFQQFDVDNSGVNEDYFGKLTWTSTHTINELYERAKGQTADTVETTDGSDLVYGINGMVFRGVTHDFAYDNESGGISISDFDKLVFGTAIAYNNESSGPFEVGEAVVEDSATPQWAGRVLMIDDNGATGTLIVAVSTGTVETGDSFTGQTSGAGADVNGTPTAVTGGGVLHVIAHDSTGDNLYVQVIKGVAPSNNTRLYYGGTDLSAGDATDYIDVDGTVTEHSVSTPYIGVSTGSAIIGAYGVGIDNAKLTQNDLVFDLTNTAVSPPNNVTNTVAGLVAGEDYILVAPWDGSSVDTNGDPAIETDQMSINATYNSAGVTTISVNDIPGSTPDSGTLRVVNDEGFHIKCFYSSYDDTTDDFTLIGSDTFVDGNVTVGSDLITITGHEFVDQMVVQLTTTGTLPAGLATSTDYWVIVNDANSIKLASSIQNAVAGTAVDITAASGGGTHTITPTYTNFSGSGLNDSATSGNDAYISYLDKLAESSAEAFTAVYDSDLTLVAVVRDGGSTPIKQFISSWSFTNANASLSAIRTTDA
jgi:hypothetical protein